ncbi:UNVERIFIED_CONTAM: hypothetical protein Sangu_3202200 [Sesamum angustifolium]|uniref:Uncharacterized protein n=1 Tax=Sesamum angustifolium TaxID=2727405 RepID=A0AAW2JL57_9LAMI
MPVPEPEPLFHEEAVDGRMEKDMPISQSPPVVCQGIADVATCPLGPAVPEEPLPQDDSLVCAEPVCVEPHPNTEDVALCPSGESTLQSDTEDVTKRLARHRRGRSLETSMRLIQLLRTVGRWYRHLVGLLRSVVRSTLP